MAARQWTGRPHPEAGLSLVETMVAVGLLSINLLGALSMFAVAQDGISEGAKRLEAVALVETKMERMRVADYRALLTGDTSVGDSGQGFLLNTRVTPDQPVLARSRACTIAIAAEWRDRRGRPRSVRLAMRRANPLYRGPGSPGAEL